MVPVANMAGTKGPAAVESRVPAAPADLLYGTAAVIADIHAAAHAAALEQLSKAGAKDLLDAMLEKDLVSLACSKIGCSDKDVNDKLHQAELALRQSKKEVSERAAATLVQLDALTGELLVKLETQVP